MPSSCHLLVLLGVIVDKSCLLHIKTLITNCTSLTSFELDFFLFLYENSFISKVKVCSSSNLHGPLFKSARMTKALKAIWLTRNNPRRIPNFRTVGAISDGSMGTIEGISTNLFHYIQLMCDEISSLWFT